VRVSFDASSLTRPKLGSSLLSVPPSSVHVAIIDEHTKGVPGHIRGEEDHQRRHSGRARSALCELTGVPAAGAGNGAAVGRKDGSVTPDATCTSNIEGGFVFGDRSGQLTELMTSTTRRTQSHTAKTRIAFVYDAVYPYIIGGAERRYFELAKRLSKKGYEPHLYGMKCWKGHAVIQREGIYLHGICPSKPLYTKDGRRSIWQAIYFGINCLKLIKEDFDIIDCCGFPYFSLFVCKLICLLRGKRLYSTWLEVWGARSWKEYLGTLAIFGIWVEKLCSKIPDAIIAVSEQTAIGIEQELGYRGPIYIVPNGIDFEAIGKIKPSLTKSDVIYAGRLMDFKHVDLLIKAVAVLKTNTHDIKCIIIGDGPEKDKLVDLTTDLGLQTNIEFIGFLKHHDDMYSYMKSSQVFVLPSTREGFGTVVLEANACGIPVITTNHKDNASQYLVNGKDGIVCGLDENEIAKSIMRFLKRNTSLTDGMNAAKSHDWNNITNQIEAAYTYV